jgi:hypothetical protein
MGFTSDGSYSQKQSEAIHASVGIAVYGCNAYERNNELWTVTVIDREAVG